MSFYANTMLIFLLSLHFIKILEGFMKNLILITSLFIGLQAQAQNSYVCRDSKRGNIEVKIDLKEGLVRIYDLSSYRSQRISVAQGNFRSYCRNKHPSTLDCSHELLPRNSSAELQGYMRIYQDSEGLKKYYDLTVKGVRHYGWCR